MPNSSKSGAVNAEMASELQISEGSVRNIVKRKLKLRSYKLNKAHFLDERMKLQRRLASTRIHNSQNHRALLGKKGPAAQLVQRSLFPQSVMVWGGICATGKTPLVFIARNVKINANVYQNTILRAVLHPWAQQHFSENNSTDLISNMCCD
uniref:HTH luxR-type domain-containing protein n=1 Tax=Globodera pallida TaxID=36090 RepID=A0A183BN43_GLOPA